MFINPVWQSLSFNLNIGPFTVTDIFEFYHHILVGFSPSPHFSRHLWIKQILAIPFYLPLLPEKLYILFLFFW